MPRSISVISAPHRLSTFLGRLGVLLFENCVYLALLTATVWVGITRWEGRPAKPRQPGEGSFAPVKLTPADDRTEELMAALDALPRPPRIDLPEAPSGWQWASNPLGVTMVGDALCGEWRPEVRRNLKSAVDFVLSPEVQAVLSKLESIEPGAWRGGPGNVPASRSMQRLSYAAVLFAVRARYYSEGVSDSDAALSDLSSVYKLAAFSYNANSFQTVWTGMGCEKLAHEELRQLVRVHLLSAAQHEHIRATVDDTGPSRGDLYNRIMERNLAAMQGLLEGGFSLSDDGSGYLAISYLERLSRPDWAQSRRSGLWNLFSVFFNDRASVGEKIRHRAQAYRRLSELSFAGARDAIADLRKQNPFNLTDGPIGGARQATGIWTATLDAVTKRMASCNASAIALALSAHRAQHGRYPESLADLDGGHLLPADPYGGTPFGYAPQGEGDFVLYAMGPNLTDDAGRPHQVDEKTGVTALDGDICFHLPRMPPLYEPELVEMHR